jgi:hypothetical protein
LGLLVWLAMALSILAEVRLPSVPVPKPHLAAGIFAFVIFGVAAWQVAPSVPGGDEPHYLVITQSLLTDHDLKIENNHRRGDYQAYFAGELKPDYRRRGRDGEIYSIHAPGLPALVAPAFAVAGYHGVVLFLILFSSVGTALAWRLAWRVTGRTDAAWFGWAAVTLSTSQIFHSFTIYPDGPAGVLVLTGVWALVRAQEDAETGADRLGPWLLHGAALAVLPWLHTRFALIAASLGALVLLRLPRTRNPAGKAVAFLTVPAASALAWVAFFVVIYGTPDPSAPYPNEVASAAFIPGGLAGLLFDQRFGLLAYAPVMVFALGGLAAMTADRPCRRLGLELLFVIVPYLVAVTYFAMWWGGRSAPARFFVPMLLSTTIPAAAAWASLRRRATRATALGALAFTAFASTALVFLDGGRAAYNVRETYAYWLEWLNPVADLAHGLPTWWRDRDPELFRGIAVWCGVVGAAWALLRSMERSAWVRTRGAFCAAVAGVYGVAAMSAITVLWLFARTDGIVRMPAQLQVLRRVAAEPRLLALQLGPFRRLAADAIPPRLRIEPPPNLELGGAGQNDRPLFVLPAVPAGMYRLRPAMSGEGGMLLIGIGRDQFSIRMQPLGVSPEPIAIDFPVDVRAIVVRGDEQARRGVGRLIVEPISLVPPAARLASDYARRAVRYGPATVFFLDERSFAEPEAFWVGGERTSSVVLQPDAPASAASILVRNAPVDNHVTIETATWHEDLPLGAGEERRIQVPLDVRRGATLIRFSAASGFRPSAVDPKSRDTRFLGVWIKLE